MQCGLRWAIERINLYGVSYGTRVAQHYVRRFPNRARSVILDGVVPPQIALGPATALNAEHALTRILLRCAHDAECNKRFGDPSVAYHSLRELAAVTSGVRALWRIRRAASRRSSTLRTITWRPFCGSEVTRLSRLRFCR